MNTSEDRPGHIYLITKVYISQTRNTIAHRWSQHKSPNKRGCPYIYKAIVKHGADNFTIESIENIESIGTFRS